MSLINPISFCAGHTEPPVSAQSSHHIFHSEPVAPSAWDHPALAQLYLGLHMSLMNPISICTCCRTPPSALRTAPLYSTGLRVLVLAFALL